MVLVAQERLFTQVLVGNGDNEDGNGRVHEVEDLEVDGVNWVRAGESIE